MRLAIALAAAFVLAVEPGLADDEDTDLKTLKAASIVLMFSAGERGKLYFPSEDLAKVENSDIQIARGLKDHCSFYLTFEADRKPSISAFFSEVSTSFYTTPYKQTLHPPGYYNLYVRGKDREKLVCRGPQRGVMDCFDTIPFEYVNRSDIERITQDLDYLRRTCVKPGHDVY